MAAPLPKAARKVPPAPVLGHPIRAKDQPSAPGTESVRPARGTVPALTQRLLESLDLAAAVILVIGGALAMAMLPAGSPLRMALTLPVVLLLPGYLLIQAWVVPAKASRARTVHGLAALGLSPAIVGLLAISTSLVPGGFKPFPIVLTITVACLAAAAVALFRRLRSAAPAALPVAA